jgi:hypothetical protein
MVAAQQQTSQISLRVQNACSYKRKVWVCQSCDFIGDLGPGRGPVLQKLPTLGCLFSMGLDHRLDRLMPGINNTLRALHFRLLNYTMKLLLYSCAHFAVPGILSTYDRGCSSSTLLPQKSKNRGIRQGIGLIYSEMSRLDHWRNLELAVCLGRSSYSGHVPARIVVVNVSSEHKPRLKR